MLVDDRGRFVCPSWLPIYETRAQALAELKDPNPADSDGLAAAMYYCDWQRVADGYRNRLSRSDEHAPDHSRLGLALLRQGAIEQARECCIRAALRAPDEPSVRQLQWELREWELMAGWIPELPQAARRTERLRLDLLGPHHWEDLLWQYQDPQIAALCCLPRFQSYRHFRDWLASEYGRGDVLMFAVVEHGTGFGGVVALIRHRGVGFVYYWLGRELRGRGLAMEAVSCLLAMAGRLWGLRACYAKVYDFNQPSRRLLSRLGFDELPMVPEAPHQDELLYRLGCPQSDRETNSELRTLLADMRSDVRVRPWVVL